LEVLGGAEAGHGSGNCPKAISILLMEIVRTLLRSSVMWAFASRDSLAADPMNTFA